MEAITMMNIEPSEVLGKAARSIEECLNTGWSISDDISAEWALKKIQSIENDATRIIDTAKAFINYYTSIIQVTKSKTEQDISFFTGLLERYFNTLELRETKSQKIYDLPSGKLIRKRVKPQRIITDEDALTIWAAKTDPDYINVNPNFSMINSECDICNGNLILRDTGEVVPGIEYKDQPDEFTIQLRRGKGDK